MVLDESERNCVDLNECNTPGYCQYGTCTNKLDGKGFNCQCNAGFMKTRDEKSCEGIASYFESLAKELSGRVPNPFFFFVVYLTLVENANLNQQSIFHSFNPFNSDFTLFITERMSYI